MSTRAGKWIGATGWWSLALALLAGACGGTTANTPSLGSESHFLERCAGSCEGGLDCIGGICTRACLTASSSCTDLAPGASCTDQSVEPGEVAVCDVACSATADCGSLGSGYRCQGQFCRAASGPVSTETPAETPAAMCEGYADQTPPPDVRGFTITNRGSRVLYLQPFTQCPTPYDLSLVQVLREQQVVNTLGGGCALSCQDTLLSGWSLPGEQGQNTPDCFGLDCVAPSRVPIQPGETLFDAARLEVVFRQLPQACAQGISTASVNCYQKVIPQRGSYSLNVLAYTEPGCSGANCPAPIVFSQPTEWYFENHDIDIE